MLMNNCNVVENKSNYSKNMKINLKIEFACILN